MAQWAEGRENGRALFAADRGPAEGADRNPFLRK